MGLGTHPDISLAQARMKTVEARELIAQVVDPKEQRNALTQTKKAATEHTFENVATWFELKQYIVRLPLPSSMIDAINKFTP